MMVGRCVLKYRRISPKKVAPIASYKDKGGEEPVENLYVSLAKVDRGVILKRVRPMFRGMATLIRKRTSHITIEVSPGR